ncbi:MAG: hypothetical protein U0325_26985 [Polyangiales bacterium]
MGASVEVAASTTSGGIGTSMRAASTRTSERFASRDTSMGATVSVATVSVATVSVATVSVATASVVTVSVATASVATASAKPTGGPATGEAHPEAARACSAQPTATHDETDPRW